MMLFTSCTALSEFVQLGAEGWLELGSDPEITPEITTEEAPSSVPSSLPQSTVPVTNTPESTETVITSLPIIPESPSISELIEKLSFKDFGKAPIMLSYTGDPRAFTGIGSDKIISAIDSLEKKYNLGKTLYNKRTLSQLDELLEGEEYFADLLYISYTDAVRYYRSGYLAPISKDLISLKTEGAYYPEATRDHLTPQGDMFFVLPSSSTPYESSIVIYCNTDLLSRATGLSDIVNVTKEGALDIETLYKYVALSAEKLPEGYTSLSTDISPEILELVAQVEYSSKKGTDIAGYLLEHCSYCSAKDGVQSFFDGNSVFYISTVSTLRDFREAADSYAILPFPKDNITDGEYPLIYHPDDIYVFAIPESAVNKEIGIALIDGLALCSRFEFRFNFIESMYASYIRQHDSIVYTGVSRLDGTSVSKAEPTAEPDTTPDVTKDNNENNEEE